jgi:hypothetical protein
MVRYEEYIRTSPKITAIAEPDNFAEIYAPKSAPKVVAISRNIPMRILVKPSFTYAEAAPDEVAITEIREAPTAYLISTPNTNVNKGMITTPPPKPVKDPRNPALNDASQISAEKSNRFISYYILPPVCPNGNFKNIFF